MRHNQLSHALFLAGMLLTIQAHSAPGGEDRPFPRVQQVEAQPLLSQIARLRRALDFLGDPLPTDVKNQLDGLSAGMDAEVVTAEVQRLLDPQCGVAIQIDADGGVRVTAPEVPLDLTEQGWRTFLIKVHNQAGWQSALQVSSPNSQPVPGSPQSDVENRWMDLAIYNGRPLSPDLSGLELEYRVFQIYSRDPGERSGELSFRLEPPTPQPTETPGAIRRWQFGMEENSWQAANNCKLVPVQSALQFEGTGPDPYMTTSIDAKPGQMVFRVWAKSDRDGFGQLFWKTANDETFARPRMGFFRINKGPAREYEVRFQVDAQLKELRFDPHQGPANVDLDWITLAYATASPPQWASTNFTFRAEPSTEVTFDVKDEKGQDVMAAFVIQDQAGRVYPSQMKRVAPDFFFQPQVYRRSGEVIHLPAGQYTVRCSRGPESLPETRTLTVGDQPLTLSYQVKRWIDPTQFGYWSGDHHIHAAGCSHYTSPTEGVHAPDMVRHCMGEDLKVGCTLTWGPCFDYQKQFFTGAVDEASEYPYLVRYDIEVSGFGSHRSGHLCLLRLRDQMYPGGESSDHWPTLGLNTLRWAKRQGAITGPAHSGAGLAHSTMRVEAEDGPNGLPNYAIPLYNGIGANEYIVDITHQVPGPDGALVPAVDFISTMDTNRIAEWNMWYHTLNCGFRVRASGETDFPCISGQRVGMGRVYVKLDDRLDYDQWCENLRLGRSYVSNGLAHIIDLQAHVIDDPANQVEVGESDSELHIQRPTRVRVTAQVAAWTPRQARLPVDLVVNAYPVAQRRLVADGALQSISFDVDIDQSSWIGLRISASAHSNPIFVLVDDQPIRASSASAEWFLRGVDQCWKMKRPTYDASELEDARQAFEHARQVYRQILEECQAREA